MLDIFILGGPLILFICLASVIAFAVFLNKIFHLHRAQIDTQKFMKGIKNVLQKKNYVEAATICSDTPGPVSAVIKSGLLKHDKREYEIKAAIEMASLLEIPRLEKDINALLTISYVAPLLGFLGTSTGLMKVFMKIQERCGAVNLADISGGMWEALVCTAGGLAVSIFAFLAYNYLMNRVNSFVLDMERCSAELVGILSAGEDER